LEREGKPETRTVDADVSGVGIIAVLNEERVGQGIVGGP
jgi:hypothetical protein